MVLKYEHAEIFYVDFQRMEYVITPEELIYYIHYIMPVEMLKQEKTCYGKLDRGQPGVDENSIR